MNSGRRLKRMLTENWREKIISLLLAFLFWFMIKAQDARNTQPYMLPPAQVLTQSTPAPSQLEPTLVPSTPVSPELNPVVDPPAPVPPLPGAAPEPGGSLVPARP